MSSSKISYIHFVASIKRSLALNRDLDHKFYMLRNTQEKHGIGRIVVEKDYLEALDRFFSTLCNICREDRLDAFSRLKLLEFIKMRAMRWRTNENVTNYFTTKLSQLENTIEIAPAAKSKSFSIDKEKTTDPLIHKSIRKCRRCCCSSGSVTRIGKTCIYICSFS